MRFFENGPSIPDELLIARDEGRVVFFCGAGVSKARAKLLDFFRLVEKVIGLPPLACYLFVAKYEPRHLVWYKIVDVGRVAHIVVYVIEFYAVDEVDVICVIFCPGSDLVEEWASSIIGSNG